MKKLLLFITGIAMTAAMIIAPVKDTKASTDYVLTSQAQTLYNNAQNEVNDARRDVDYARDRVRYLKDRDITGQELDDAYKNLDEAYRNVSRKEDKVSKARYVLDFVNSRSDSEVFLAQMQEKFRNQASLKPMQDKIDGAKAVASAQLTQINIIQDAIRSQSALAQVNPAVLEQVNQLNASYQQELAQYQQELNVIQELQNQYNAFAATMPMPTAQDNMKLSEIRSDFAYAAGLFDQASAE